jgi:hypothetical protein
LLKERKKDQINETIIAHWENGNESKIWIGIRQEGRPLGRLDKQQLIASSLWTKLSDTITKLMLRTEPLQSI